MKRYIALCFILMIQTGDATVTSMQHRETTGTPVSICLDWYISASGYDDIVAQRCSTCLAYSGHFTCATHKHWYPSYCTEYVRQAFCHGYTIYIQLLYQHDMIVWSIYDVTNSRLMRSGHIVHAETPESTAHYVADDIWHALTGLCSPFLSRLAYVKQLRVPKHHTSQYALCVADFDGARERTLITSPEMITSLRWGVIDEEPVIIFTQLTEKNGRVCMAGMNGRMWVICDRSGINTGCTPFQNEWIYVHAGDIWKCTFHSADATRVHTRCVSREYACSSPTYGPDHGLYFATADGALMYWNRLHDQVSSLMSHGVYQAPSYHQATQKIVCVRQIDGVMQAYTYHPATEKQYRITRSQCDVQDPAWSACGAYIAYTCNHDIGIYIQHIHTGIWYYITDTHCTLRCPTWSYGDIPSSTI